MQAEAMWSSAAVGYSYLCTIPMSDTGSGPGSAKKKKKKPPDKRRQKTKLPNHCSEYGLVKSSITGDAKDTHVELLGPSQTSHWLRDRI